MIKLKDILCESTVNTNDIVESLNYWKYDINLYRGSRSKYPDELNYMVCPKDRLARDTTFQIDSYIEAYRNIFYRDKPSRRNVIFCTPNLNYSGEYGSNCYVCVPDIQSKLYTFPTDSIDGAGSPISFINAFFKNISATELDLIKNNCPISFKAITEYNTMKLYYTNKDNIKILDKFFDTYLYDLIQELKDITIPNSDDEGYYHIYRFKTKYNCLDERYFNKIKSINTINAHSTYETKECWITNGGAYLIDRAAFEYNFKYIDGVWSVK